MFRTQLLRRLGLPPLLVVAISMGLLGSAMLLMSRAETSVAGTEAESGQASNGVSRVSSAEASGRSYIRFMAASNGVLPYGYGTANGPQGTWNLKLNDNFDGSALDAATWSTGWLASGITPPVQPQELACYDPAQVVVEGGMLKLQAVARTNTCGGKSRPYASGAVNSYGKREFSYGFFEARVWLDGANNAIYNWPAWWMDGHNWPNEGELDIMEGLSGGARATWHGPEGGGSGHGFGDGGYMAGWHIFAAEWEPGKVSAYYDGVYMGSYSSASNITSYQQFLILMAQISPEGQYGGPVKVPSEVDVDYVRVWQR